MHRREQVLPGYGVNSGFLRYPQTFCPLIGRLLGVNGQCQSFARRILRSNVYDPPKPV
jgi:hypothetical protein